MSRGPWTDEGLNTFQLRNWLNNGEFSLVSGDNFIKTPLYQLFLLPFFALFGSSLELTRLYGLLVILVLVFISHKRTIQPLVWTILLLIVFCFFPIFQYAHLAIPEVLASTLVCFGILEFFRTEERPNRLFIWIGLATLLKVQFAYLLVLPPLLILSLQVACRVNIWRTFFKSLLLLTGLLLVGVLLWYLPFQQEWKWVWQQQSGGFHLSEISLGLIKENLLQFFFNRSNLLFSGLVIFALFLVLVRFIKRTYSSTECALILGALIWMILESHKLGMAYLPTRYLVSTYFSIGLFTSLAFSFEWKTRKSVFKMISSVGILTIFFSQIWLSFESFQEREFETERLQKCLQEHAETNDVIWGVYATAATFNGKQLAYPIWSSFEPSLKRLKTSRPQFILSEENQEDSGKALSEKLLNQYLLVDSFQIGHRRVLLYQREK